MTAQNKSIRICNDCIWYNIWPEDYRVGRCLLFDAVDSIKRDPCSGGVNSRDSCRYGLSNEEREDGFTQAQIAEIMNRAPETLREKVTTEDISPILV